MIEMAEERMRLALEVGVPLRVHEIRSRKGPSDFDLDRCREFAIVLGSKGDVLQHGSKKNGEVANLMGQLIDAIAVMACMPGGIDFLGMHWEA